jgi:hypothetical protein
MKFQRVELTFRKVEWFYGLIPDGMTVKEIETVAKEMADDGLRDFDGATWQAEVKPFDTIEIPDEDCRLVPHRSGYYRLAKPTVFQVSPTLVLSDDHDTFVNAEDAQWWTLSDEEIAERRATERRLQDINHPDQMHLFGGASK